MRSLNWIQAKINRNGVLAAALRDGSIQVVYKKAEISADNLSVTWRLTVFIIDVMIAEIVGKTLKRMGFAVEVVGETMYAVQEFLLSSDEKALIKKEAAATKEQEREEEAKATVQTLRATETTVSDLQQQIEALREELELIRLMPAAKGRKGGRGDKGDRGAAGEAGKDMVASEANLGDLQDVSDLPPEPGQVLTWDQIDQQWTPKSAKSALTSIGGGGAGGGGGGGIPLTVGTYGPQGDVDTVTAVSAIRFSTSSGFSVVEGDNGAEALIALNSTFKTWRIPEQDDLVAEGEDLINITSSGSVTLTTSTVGTVKTLNIHAPGSGGGGGGGSLTYWEETQTADLIPLSDMTQDLGSGEKSIKGIYLGGKLLSVNTAGELCIDHKPLAYVFAPYDGRDIVDPGSDWNDVADGGEIASTSAGLSYTLADPNNFTTPAADGGTLEEDD